MALTLVKEDGTGLSNANSYASAADGDSYHEGHIYATSWTAATSSKKEAALVMATRIIDACYQFGGFKSDTDQALQWPRSNCRNPDSGDQRLDILSNNRSSYFDEDDVPAVLVQATCEFARELIKSDSTDAPPGQGVAQMSVTGATFVQYDKRDQQPIIGKTIQMMLMKLGTYFDGRSNTAKLVRA